MVVIDLRSDTVTLPTDEMRTAICNAELGDDVFAEDPTTNRLQAMAAELMGKEAGLLVSSGTQGNLVCTLTHCKRGEEAILGDVSHIFLNEAGGMAVLGGIHPHTVPNQPDGTMRLDDIEAAIRGDNDHWPRTRLICLENTHNRCFGAAIPPDYFASVASLARRHNLSIHCDGARIFNAVVALGIDVKEFTQHVDSVTFCLSKGLSAPIGSVVCGSQKFIAEARRNRKILGGGMRQCGIIAAAGITAIEVMIERLQEDQDNARRLAEGISKIPGLSIDLKRIQTNIVYCDLTLDHIEPDTLVEQLGKRGIKFLRTGSKRYRMVTHYGISRDDIDTTLKILSEVMTSFIQNR
jgi:threonine aldolase